MFKKAILASAVLAAGFGATTAQAELTGNIGVASNYLFRGVNTNEAQVSGGIDWSHDSGLYIGSWASNTSANGEEELDLYVGYATGMFDFGAITYLFPSDNSLSETGNGSHGNLTEAYIGVSGDNWGVTGWYGFGADNTEDDEYGYLEANVDAGPIGVHIGFTSFIGDAVENQDDILDAAVSYNVDTGAGTFSAIVSVTDADNNDRPQFTVGWGRDFEIK